MLHGSWPSFRNWNWDTERWPKKQKSTSYFLQYLSTQMDFQADSNCFQLQTMCSWMFCHCIVYSLQVNVNLILISNFHSDIYNTWRQCIQPHACVFTIQPHACGCIRKPGFGIQPHVWWLHRVKGVQPCFLVNTLSITWRNKAFSLLTKRGYLMQYLEHITSIHYTHTHNCSRSGIATNGNALICMHSIFFTFLSQLQIWVTIIPNKII